MEAEENIINWTERLETIRQWDAGGYKNLMDFVKLCWWSDFGTWEEIETKNDGIEYHISTGGWSGNESIIEALMDNYVFWSLCWVQSRRGGHYIFEIDAVPATTTMLSGEPPRSGGSPLELLVRTKKILKNS